jgi:hypothetical protein
LASDDLIGWHPTIVFDAEIRLEGDRLPTSRNPMSTRTKFRQQFGDFRQQPLDSGVWVCVELDGQVGQALAMERGLLPGPMFQPLVIRLLLFEGLLNPLAEAINHPRLTSLTQIAPGRPQLAPRTPACRRPAAKGRHGAATPVPEHDGLKLRLEDR